MFKWICLAVGVVFAGAILWMVDDMRREVRRSLETVNKDLPQIVEKSKQTAETMGLLAGDVKQLRELVVGEPGQRDAGLIAYESEVFKLIENSGGSIGVKKLTGRGLTDTVPAKEWVVRERKMALLDLARARSKADLLDRLGRSTVLGRTWYIEFSGKEPTTLVEWVRANHPGSRD